MAVSMTLSEFTSGRGEYTSRRVASKVEQTATSLAQHGFQQILELLVNLLTTSEYSSCA